MNGHIIGFHPRTQKLESPYKAPLSTLAVKGLIRRVQVCQIKAKQIILFVQSKHLLSSILLLISLLLGHNKLMSSCTHIVSQDHGHSHIFIIRKVNSAPEGQAAREGDLGTSPGSSETQFPS